VAARGARSFYAAGKLGAVADAVYASYRMARPADPCRADEVPSVGSLVGNVLRRRTESQPPAS
jgi:hypothetical protein